MELEIELALQFFTIFIFCIGIFTNIPMLFHLYHDTNLKKFSKSILILQSVWDLLFSLFPVLHKLILLLTKYDLRAVTSASWILCPAHMFLTELIWDLSNWTCMLITMERLLLIVFIKNYRLNNLTIYNTFQIMFIFVLVSTIKNCLTFLSTVTLDICVLPANYKLILFMVIDMLLKIIIPVLVILACSIIMFTIIHTNYKSHSNNNSSNNINNSPDNTNKSQYNDKKVKQKSIKGRSSDDTNDNSDTATNNANTKGCNKMPSKLITLSKVKLHISTSVNISLFSAIYFTISNLPFAFLNIYFGFRSRTFTVLNKNILLAFELILYSNCFLKPIFYLWLSSEFRNKLTKLFKHLIRISIIWNTNRTAHSGSNNNFNNHDNKQNDHNDDKNNVDPNQNLTKY